MGNVAGSRKLQTYPEPRTASASALPPLSFESHTTGLFQVTGALPLPFLEENLGDPLGFDIPQQDAGTFVVINFGGALRNFGAGAFPQIQLVVNGIARDFVFGVECGGGIPVVMPSNPWRIELDPNLVTNTVRFTIFDLNGNTVGCDPEDDLPTWVSVTGILTS